jgi:hypothetical protein
LTCPKPSVWRTGSVQSASGTATTSRDRNGRPCRAAIGATSTASTTVSASTLPAAFSQPAVSAGTRATGVSTNAANGG